MANAADNIYAMYNGADIDFPTVKDSEGKEIKITHGNFVPILSGEDRELRKNAFYRTLQYLWCNEKYNCRLLIMQTWNRQIFMQS